ncbi:hypothetical protein ACFL27_21815 [candidate division CSSED10-310 bacterium]|uniref:Uncharacterized protein n=1 Tax=candidate division CSSED10-310 bacterium TaxID=2855610 RepID=A0ABV6Z321_UNCC1
MKNSKFVFISLIILIVLIFAAFIPSTYAEDIERLEMQSKLGFNPDVLITAVAEIIAKRMELELMSYAVNDKARKVCKDSNFKMLLPNFCVICQTNSYSTGINKVIIRAIKEDLTELPLNFQKLLEERLGMVISAFVLECLKEPPQVKNQAFDSQKFIKQFIEHFSKNQDFEELKNEIIEELKEKFPETESDKFDTIRTRITNLKNLKITGIQEIKSLFGEINSFKAMIISKDAESEIDNFLQDCEILFLFIQCLDDMLKNRDNTASVAALMKKLPQEHAQSISIHIIGISKETTISAHGRTEILQSFVNEYTTVSSLDHPTAGNIIPVLFKFLDVIESNLDEAQKSKNIIPSLRTAVKIYSSLLKKDFAGIVLNFQKLVGNFSIKFNEDIMRALILGVELSSAGTAEEMKASINTIIAPLGAYKIKQNSNLMSLTAYPGLALGHDSFQGSINEKNDDIEVDVISLIAPIGFEYSWHRYGFGVFVSLIDFGSLLTINLTKKEVETYEGYVEVKHTENVTLQDIFIPGIYLKKSFGDSPFILLGGVSYQNNLVYDEQDQTHDVAILRFTVSFSVDVTLFPFN